MSFDQLTITKYLNSNINPVDLLEWMEEQYKKNKHLNAVIEDWYSNIITKTKEKLESNKNFKNIPFGLKDNFFVKDKNITAASKMLKNLHAPFDSTVTKRLEQYCNADFVVRCNMDEFAMGGSGITSTYGETISNFTNSKNELMSPGGSSSGSAVALSTNMCLASIGTDTGGSVRIPAAFCNLVGLKPTYGVLSRYGIVDFASGLDCPGLFTKTSEDSQWLFNKIIGKDENDFTSVDYIPQKTKKTVGVLKNFASEESQKSIDEAKEKLLKENYDVVEVKTDLLKYMVPCYYVLACSEAASNLNRYSGIFYNQTESDHYLDARSEFFGDEVQRRIVTGNFMMFCGNMEGFYNKARRILSKLWEELSPALEKCDFIITPVSNSGPQSLEKIKNDSITDQYSEDFFTCFANLLGLPAMSIPMGFNSENLPRSIQLVSKPFGENLIFQGANIIGGSNE